MYWSWNIPAVNAIGATGTLVFATAITSAGTPPTYSGSWSTPSLDRWMYPFNGTPGTRQTISTFGSTPGDVLFDSRDGQFLMAWNTSDQIPTGWDRSALRVGSARVIIQVANDLAMYDPTPDPWQCFVASTDPAWQVDSDAGQPVELFAAGYRNGWTAATFVETGPFAPSGTSVLLPGVRNVFAAEVDSAANAIDVSSHVRSRFDAAPLAVGQCTTVAAGEVLTLGSELSFDFNVSNPSVQSYVADGLQSGRLVVIASSLTFVVQGGGNYPSFFAKEHPFVVLGAASAARLEVTLVPACPFADLDCNGSIGGEDLAILLGNWAQPGVSDIDANGSTDGADLAALLSVWQ